jgi:hypothetical protein
MKGEEHDRLVFDSGIKLISSADLLDSPNLIISKLVPNVES